MRSSVNFNKLLLAGELSQLQPLVEYQQRMLQDLTDSAQRLREVLKANEVLEQRLESANKDLECEKQRRQDYENRLVNYSMLVCIGGKDYKGFKYYSIMKTPDFVIHLNITRTAS